MPQGILATFFHFVSFVAHPVEYPFHRSVIFSFTVLFHGTSPVESRLDQDRVVRPKRYSTGRRLVYPIFSLSRQDAKTAKKTFLILLLGVLCPVEYRLDQDRVVLPKRYSTGESYLFSDSLNPNSTENFKFLWIVIVYHEAHEDHEEFTIKLFRPLCFKARGRYNLMTGLAPNCAKASRRKKRSASIPFWAREYLKTVCHVNVR